MAGDALSNLTNKPLTISLAVAYIISDNLQGETQSLYFEEVY